MEIYIIPFDEKFIIYRPLRRLAFLGNAAMVRYIQERVSERDSIADGDVDKFLDAIGFWIPDPEPPEPWNPSDEHRPTMAVLLMTTACNLRCTYCYARGGEGPIQNLTFPLARTVVDAAHENALAGGRKYFSATFHGGGEPTVNWEVMTAAIDHIRSKELPCRISMSTNGVMTDQKREFVLKHFNGLSLSFDGIQDVQDSQRPMANGKGSFEAVMETIRSMDERGFPYGVRMTATPDSFARLAESVAFICEETQCKGIQVEPCYATERGEYADPSPEQAEPFIRGFIEAFEIAADARRSLSYSGARPWLIASSFCRASKDALVVTPEADLVTCFETYSRRHPLTSRFTVGRVTSDGVQIDADALRSFASQQSERRASCEGCFCYWHCGGDCASRCMLSHKQSRTRCYVNRELTKYLLACYISAGNGIWHGTAMHRIKREGMNCGEEEW